MRICFFGTYTKAEGYPVNRVLISGLRQAGAEVLECREELWGRFLYRAYSGRSLARLLELCCRVPTRYLRLAWQYWRCRSHDWVMVGYAGYLDVHLARLLRFGRRRPIALVSFISLYDTLVRDRSEIREGAWRARCLKWIDTRAFCAADLVLVDTEAQRRYYAETFGVPLARFHRSYVGEDDEQFSPGRPQPRDHADLRVLFFGTYVPLHGVDVILGAAEQLADQGDVDFTLIGSGQFFEPLRRRAAELNLGKVCFIDEWVGTADLVEHISRCDLCLGIFGRTAKAARVIPYKVFDALAMAKPVITRDSPAVRELLVDGESAILCEPGSALSLSRAIVRLRDDGDLRKRIAAGGYSRYREHGCPGAIGRALVTELEGRDADS